MSNCSVQKEQICHQFKREYIASFYPALFWVDLPVSVTDKMMTRNQETRDIWCRRQGHWYVVQTNKAALGGATSWPSLS